jgi:signal transduction histidine kinase
VSPLKSPKNEGVSSLDTSWRRGHCCPVTGQAVRVPRIFTTETWARFPVWLDILLAVFPISSLETVVESSLWSHAPLLAAANLLGEACFLTASVLLWHDRDQQGTAAIVFMIGVCQPLGWIGQWNGGPLPICSQIFGYLNDTCLVWVLLRYPRQSLGKLQRAYLLAFFAWLTGGSLLLAIVSRPQWNDSTYKASAWWPTWYPNRELFGIADRIFYAGALGAAVLLLVVVWTRVAAAGTVERPELVSAAWIGTLCIIVALAVTGAEFLGATNETIWAGEGYVIAAVPAVFILTDLYHKIRNNREAADLVIGLPEAGALPDVRKAVQDILRQVVRDSSLLVFFRDVPSGSYVDVYGSDSGLPPPKYGRTAMPVYANSRADGDPFAIIHADAAITRYRHQDSLASAVKACVLGLENARLRAENEVSLADNLKLLRRIAMAEESIRKEIGLEIHDRGQAPLQAAKMRLDGYIDATSDEQACSHMKKTKDEILDIIQIFREIAENIHPPVLLKYGLGEAIRGFAEKYPLRIHVDDATDHRFIPTLEFNAYMVACEAITNAARHASASVVTVRVYTEDVSLQPCNPSAETLCVEVSDDGIGGAREGAGSGLMGLRDRVRALGGVLDINSPKNSGTQILARMPCV